MITRYIILLSLSSFMNKLPVIHQQEVVYLFILSQKRATGIYQGSNNLSVIMHGGTVKRSEPILRIQTGRKQYSRYLIAQLKNHNCVPL